MIKRYRSIKDLENMTSEHNALIIYAINRIPGNSARSAIKNGQQSHDVP
jgi:hypothetical protein